MAKTSVVKPAFADFQDKPWFNITDFYTDCQSYEQYKIGLEALGSQQNIAPTAGDISAESGCDNTTVILKKNDEYHVYFHIFELVTDWGVNLTSFSEWLHSLREDETIYLYQTGNVWNITYIVQILGVLASECLAKKIFVVDHPIDNALFLTVCDEVKITPLGAINFSNCLNIDRNKWDLIYLPYLKSLFAKAQEMKLISEAEVEDVIDNNAIVYKTYRQLVEQGAVT